MVKEYKLLVFDWDGTLMDSAAEIVSCFQHAAGDLSLRPPTDAEVRNIIGVGMREAIQMLYPDMVEEADLQALIERYRHYYFLPEKPESQLFEGVYDMLKALEGQEYFLGLATSKGRRGLDQVLARTGLDKVFHYTRCIDEAHSKPHPKMLLDVMAWLGVDAADTLMIGDTEYDLQMARNARVDSVGVLCGAHEHERLLACEPKTCLPETAQLIHWLAR